MKKKLKIVAVILAAGEGRRFSDRIPKQYVIVNNKPILFYTLKKFVNCNIFSEIVVVVNKEWIKKAPKIISILFKKAPNIKIEYIEGGNSRSQSSYNAIKFLKNKNIDYVLFHDGVRPFINKDIINKVVDVAKKYGTAIAGIKTIESVARVLDSKIASVFSSKDLFYLQTPECFKFDVIAEAYKKFSKDKKYFQTATNLHLLFDLKKEISVVQHYERNLKLTFPSDLKITKFFQ